MKPGLFKRKLLIKNSLIHGYGVFADESIKVDDIIEECWVFLLDYQPTALAHYLFQAGAASAFPAGNGALYNHSPNPNANYEYDVSNNLITFTAREAIKPGQEILIDYGPNWFADRKIKIKGPSLWERISSKLTLMLKLLVVFGVIALFKIMQH